MPRRGRLSVEFIEKRVSRQGKKGESQRLRERGEREKEREREFRSGRSLSLKGTFAPVHLCTVRDLLDILKGVPGFQGGRANVYLVTNSMYFFIYLVLKEV